MIKVDKRAHTTRAHATSELVTVGLFTGRELGFGYEHCKQICRLAKGATSSKSPFTEAAFLVKFEPHNRARPSVRVCVWGSRARTHSFLLVTQTARNKYARKHPKKLQNVRYPEFVFSACHPRFPLVGQRRYPATTLYEKLSYKGIRRCVVPNSAVGAGGNITKLWQGHFPLRKFEFENSPVLR